MQRLFFCDLLIYKKMFPYVVHSSWRYKKSISPDFREFGWEKSRYCGGEILKSCIAFDGAKKLRRPRSSATREPVNCRRKIYSVHKILK